MYGALDRGRTDVERLCLLLANIPLPRLGRARLVLAVGVLPWLRSDAPCSAERLFCHVHGRAKSASQLVGRMRSDQVMRLPRRPRTHGIKSARHEFWNICAHLPGAVRAIKARPRQRVRQTAP